MTTVPTRQFPVGAEVHPGGVHFRVWAERCKRVQLVFEPGKGREKGPDEVDLQDEGSGYFSAFIPSARDGDLYRFRLDGDRGPFPDPASRFQPDGPHGPSQVVDPARFAWADDGWKGVRLKGQVIYEMHVGTFTREGTWDAAARELRELARCGMTVIEVMPVAEFSGSFGWGYDGVDLFAPFHLYGSPEDFRSFVDQAHGHNLAVILDVVYNHLGPDGNYLTQFSNSYFTDRYRNEWGSAVNFDGENAGPVREFFATNALYWVTEFHLDGLRLDATQTMNDASPDHIVRVITKRIREGLRDRTALVVAENEPQEVIFLQPYGKGGYDVDALWNDDYHHTAVVAATGHREAYYRDYQGTAQELVSSIKYGYLFQGQYYSWQRQNRGTAAFDIDPERFVVYVENHDQVANSGRGHRFHQLTSPGIYRAMTALTLLSPGTPMLCQGQEFAASAPFLYFADLPDRISASVSHGRIEFLAQFKSLSGTDMQSRIAASISPDSFHRSKLDFSDRQRHGESYRLHIDLLRLRRTDPVFRAQRKGGLDGAVAGDRFFVLRFFGDEGDDRLVAVNLGLDILLMRLPEPLVAPPHGRSWEILWSSEDFLYGGSGTPPFTSPEEWSMPGQALVVFRPKR